MTPRLGDYCERNTVISLCLLHLRPLAGTTLLQQPPLLHNHPHVRIIAPHHQIFSQLAAACSLLAATSRAI
jgi:hypothetical protein